MTTYAVYVGLSNVRTIKAADWTSLAIANTGDTTWQSSNSWSIDQATLSAGQIAYLATQADFLTGQGATRPGGGVVDNPFGYVTNAALASAMRAGFVSDGGGVTQWLANTPAQQGTVWGYLGTLYLRMVSGTDAVFTRANWTALGADPGVVGGAELANTPLSVTATVAAITTGYTDIPGAVVAPVVPSGGRAIYVELDDTIAASVASISALLQLYDVTAGAAVPTTRNLFMPTTANKGTSVFARWRLTPAAGARAYKLQVKTDIACNFTCYGADFNILGSLVASVR